MIYEFQKISTVVFKFAEQTTRCLVYFIFELSVCLWNSYCYFQYYISDSWAVSLHVLNNSFLYFLVMPLALSYITIVATMTCDEKGIIPVAIIIKDLLKQ